MKMTKLQQNEALELMQVNENEGQHFYQD